MNIGESLRFAAEVIRIGTLHNFFNIFEKLFIKVGGIFGESVPLK